MLLLLVGVVVSVWLRLFAGRPLRQYSVTVRLAVAVGALATGARLMEARRRL